jgi:hypothetical protein
MASAGFPTVAEAATAAFARRAAFLARLVAGLAANEANRAA